MADLPKSCYAYAPGDDRSKWKLPICDDDTGKLSAGRVGAAAAALGKGFRGQKVDLPSDAVSGAKAKVRAAWKKLNPDKDDDEMPEGIKASETPSATWKTADEDERPTRDYLAAFINKLKELAGVTLAQEDIDAAHKHARSSAGGKGKAKKRRQDAVTYREHAVEHPELVQGCEYCHDPFGYRGEVLKLPKQDERVNYRDAGADNMTAGDRIEACANCRFYEFGSCHLVEGAIEAPDVCDLYLAPVKTWLPTPMLYSVAGQHNGAWQLFTELPHGFAEAPDWVNILPKPGNYTHPSYGAIVITPDRNHRFKDNFDNGVYQQRDIPITIDIEHDGKMSGAMGYFDELRINEDGSVDAKIAWTDTGRQMLEEDRFKYFSPEWWDVWTQPSTGEQFQDVLVGGAICVRPFFKEDALRPLVANEQGIVAAGVVSDDRMTIWMQPVAAHETKGAIVPDNTPVQLSEDEVKQLRETAAEAVALRAEVTALTEAKQAFEARAAAIEAKERTQRFTNVVRGRDGQGDGAAWPGAIEDNVAHLVALAETLGEESDLFKNHVATMSAAAKTLAEAGAFKPIGSSEAGTGGSAFDEVEQAARTLMREDSALTYSAAMSRVFSEKPELYERHRLASIARTPAAE